MYPQEFYKVKGAISMLANIASEGITVKRKFKTTAEGKLVLRWWFVLRAEESVLKKLGSVGNFGIFNLQRVL